MKLKTIITICMSLLLFIAATTIVIKQTQAKNKPFLYNKKIINITNLSNVVYNDEKSVVYNNEIVYNSNESVVYKSKALG